MTVRAAMIGIPLFLACGTSTPPAATEPHDGPNACGMLLYTEPACEAALDRSCCAQQQRCRADPDCLKIVTCWNICEIRRQEMKARNETLDQCKCFAACTPEGTTTPGLKVFEEIANCSRTAAFPKNLVCASGC